MSGSRRGLGLYMFLAKKIGAAGLWTIRVELSRDQKDRDSTTLGPKGGPQNFSTPEITMTLVNLN